MIGSFQEDQQMRKKIFLFNIFKILIFVACNRIGISHYDIYILF